jgi:hypothetical protein
LDILLDPTQLPSAADAVVINVETLTRITEAIELRKPVISKNITIVGNFNNEPISRVYKDVPIGTTIDELINRTGTIESEYGEIILGGPFTGVRLPREPAGVPGGRQNVDLGNVPVVLSPNEVRDGGIHALTCIGPASKEDTRHYFREPILEQLAEDEELDLVGVVFIGSPQVNDEKILLLRD